ncbi:hypothetical protein OS493_003969 [Desmophyllum pertusum]|uniref:EGF-like repeat and discoidin I-like domain-containing protein 3 n=1 Tax=Desmophyllum pertusum TaxID=174260 RepID=A0A9W9ZSG7_9CNID|nr:hypothetical protein OS493_003969 [Desmophyllum pertusum]
MRGFKFKATARFVRFVLPPFDKRLKAGEELPSYKVELFGCSDTGKAKPDKKGNERALSNTRGSGVESGVIPDNQLTSSSNKGPGYEAQYSRLNSRSGAGAWCAGSCHPSTYLQIDLGQVHLLRELEVQSKHGDSGVTNSVLSFYFEYSADGALWKYYRVNGANKLFLGSTLRNLAVRHKLLVPVHARFVRFRPKTCINMACMRVELFSYPDSDLPPNVLNVLGYDPVGNVHYGISTNKKTFLRSKFSSFMKWTGISGNIWNKAKESPSLITATEVPFVPVLLRDENKPYEALTVSSTAGDKWGSSSRELLIKQISRKKRSVSPPGGVTEWKKVFTWIDYPYDMKIGCLGMPCDHGTCAETSNGGYRCTCFPGYKGKRCKRGAL